MCKANRNNSLILIKSKVHYMILTRNLSATRDPKNPNWISFITDNVIGRTGSRRRDLE